MTKSLGGFPPVYFVDPEFWMEVKHMEAGPQCEPWSNYIKLYRKQVEPKSSSEKKPQIVSTWNRRFQQLQSQVLTASKLYNYTSIVFHRHFKDSQELNRRSINDEPPQINSANERRLTFKCGWFVSKLISHYSKQLGYQDSRTAGAHRTGVFLRPYRCIYKGVHPQTIRNHILIELEPTTLEDTLHITLILVLSHVNINNWVVVEPPLWKKMVNQPTIWE